MSFLEIIEKIQHEVSLIKSTTNTTTPIKLILGEEIVRQLIGQMFVLHRNYEPEPNTILGFPVEVDYSNPHRISASL